MKKVLYILGEMDDDGLEWLIRTGAKKKLSADAVLISEGQPIDALYIAISGQFSVRVKAMNNREVARVGAGEVLGEMSYVDNRPPSATVVALEESLVLAIPRSALTEKLREDLGFAAHFYRSLAQFLTDRLRATNNLQAGKTSSPEDAGGVDDDELDLDQLDSASMGGARFDQIIKRLKGA